MGLKSMHAERQSEQPQQSVQDNSLIEQQSQKNSGADERARARQLLDRTAVAEDSRTGKTYQPDNTAVTEERLSNLRSYQPSRGLESQADQEQTRAKDRNGSYWKNN